MQDTQYRDALWGYSWSDIENNSPRLAQGTANLSEGRIVLDLPFGQLLRANHVVFLPQDDLPSDVNCLYGFTQNGYWLALKDPVSLGVETSTPGGPHQRIQARRLLASKSPYDPTGLITKASIRIAGLGEWFGRTPVSCTADSKFRLTSINVDWNNDEYNSVLLDDESVRIELYHCIKHSPLEIGGIELAHAAELAITFKQARSLESCIDFATSLSDFFSFCTGTYAEITALSLWFDHTASPVSCHIPLIEGKTNDAMQYARMPLPHAILENTMGRVMTSWINPQSAIQRPARLLVSLLHRDWTVPLDLRFIAASQILETLSKIDVDLNALPPETYCEYRSLALDQIEDAKVKDWASGRLNGNSKGQKRLLSDLCEKNHLYAQWLTGTPSAFVNTHIKLRNALTHQGVQSHTDNKQLYWHCTCVELFCYGAIAQFLGIDNEMLIRAFERSHYKDSAILKIRKTYS